MGVDDDLCPAASARSVTRSSTHDEDRAEAGRDWWPLAIGWAAAGEVPARPAVVARPTDTAQVAAVLALCHEARVPVTPAGGRSGVCGASVPLFGGVALDLCGLAGIGDVDDESLVADVRAGTFGPDVESGLRDGHGLTLGHWPQSMDLSTVGGWLACRGAGQYSNRYGKIEDMVIGLEVVLADGRVVRTGGRGPRSATGPDLTQLFVGSEGTLGVITEGRFRVHPVPDGRGAPGLRLRHLRRRARRLPADPAPRAPPRPCSASTTRPSRAGRSTVPDTNVLIVLDEADPGLVDATLAVVDDECAGADAARRRPGGTVARPPQRRVGPGPAVAGRHRGRHRRGGRPLDGPARPLPRGARRPGRRGGHPGGLVPPVPRLHRRRLPLLHLRRPATRRRSPAGSGPPGRMDRRATTGGPGTR